MLPLYKKHTVVLILGTLLLIPRILSAQSAESIIQKMDELQSFDSLKSTGSLITKDRFGTKTVTFISWSEGSDSSLIEFTSAAEAGQKILRTSEELFLYFPDAEEVIRLQGAALRQSMMGSDISYEDMTDGKDTLDKYEVELLGEELVEGQNCYVIEMTAKSRRVPYPKQTVWVLKESFIPQKVEYFSKSGKLLKEMRVLEVMDMDDKMIISRMVLEDKLKKNSSTEMILETIEVDVSLPSNFFSLDQLSW
ncbi:outer membrane lipoprotein-sorting protein [Oceanispirochaeta crateris]|uniref:Outer membrane lipoprotein-sorting protein n=1 Tax=Oceanispirochaeta crateris TaxID=2518645 RepID=A0A5C1QH49_9SPIO|nr:outer membrane lipoprotein-sorting protein [Oceanispirochaeta crateris]QEN06891.1 outer membrane lipoprotein-sorting protein [Oceanispirochaeta crateris]